MKEDNFLGRIADIKKRNQYLVDIMNKYGTDPDVLARGSPADGVEGPDLSEEEIDLITLFASIDFMFSDDFLDSVKAIASLYRESGQCILHATVEDTLDRIQIMQMIKV